MSERVYEQLTLFPVDSLASLLVLPGSGEAKKITVTSGLKCLELYRKSGQLGLLVKMLLKSSIWRSTRRYLTWEISATPAKRLLFRLVPSMLRTDEIDVQLWAVPNAADYLPQYFLYPTPTTGAGMCGGTGNYQQLKRMEAAGQITAEERQSMAAGNGGQLNPDWVEWLQGFPIGWTEI